MSEVGCQKDRRQKTEDKRANGLTGKPANGLTGQRADGQTGKPANRPNWPNRQTA